MPFNLNHITILVADVQASIYFYEKLGLKLIVKALPKYARFECEIGDATFSLHQNEKYAGAINKVWVYLESNNIDIDVAMLQARGIIFEELPEDKLWLWREARIKDPDGHLIILYNAGANRKNPPWRIN